MENREREKYRDAMDQIKAPEQLVERVKRLSDHAGHRFVLSGRWRCVAAGFVFFLMTSNVITYAVTGSTWLQAVGKQTTFFYTTKEERDQMAEELEDPYYRVTRPELATGELLFDEDAYLDSETYLEQVKEFYEDFYDPYMGLDDEDILVSDEVSEEESWTRKGVGIITFSGIPHIYQEIYQGTDLAGLVVNQEYMKDWDISWLGQHYTPYEKSQILLVRRAYDTGTLRSSYLSGYYLSEDGGSVFLSSSYENNRVYKNTYLDEEDYDLTEYYTTTDGVMLAVAGKGNEIQAQFCEGSFDCRIVAHGLTLSEVETIADHLNLAELVAAYEQGS